MKDISKEYFGNPVLKNVTLQVKPGEIHALVGENGAGKSTLMNILFGMPVIHGSGGFAGQVEINGAPVTIDAPHKAIDFGIGMVHQDFMLIPGFTVTENIKVGREISCPTLLSQIFSKELETLDLEQMAADARRALREIGLNIEEYVLVAGLPVGYKQFVEIAREIDKTGIKLLVFDEPTAVLTESEAERLLKLMELIAKKGIGIIFITHRLGEVMHYAHSVSILRDGELIMRTAVKDTSMVKIAELMIGRKTEKYVDSVPNQLESVEIALSLQDFHVDMPGEMVRGIDLDIRQGEIFGIGGLAGQGKLGIANGIMGLCRSQGKVFVWGRELNLGRLGAALASGIAFVSEDRRGIGLLLDQSIEHNLVFSAIHVQEGFLINLKLFKLYHRRKARKHALKMIELLDIRCTGPAQKAGSLSGGNQQKVCLARALTLNPKILIVSEPTRGIDIGAKKLVLEYLLELNRQQGMTIIIISSELVELRSLCHRIAIIADGKVAKILQPDAPDAEFGLAMSGS
jgi:simple sugar transport system ATP-binding protein